MKSESPKILFAEQFKARTKEFSIQVIKLVRKFPRTTEAFIVGKQLVKSATSVASNYRAACRARSGSEFFAKMSIVVEEADETVFWLEMTLESEMLDSASGEIKLMIIEANEILNIVSKARHTAGKNLLQ